MAHIVGCFPLSDDDRLSRTKDMKEIGMGECAEILAESSYFLTDDEWQSYKKVLAERK